MIINKYIAEPLDSSVFLNIPDPNSGVIKRYNLEGMEVNFLSNPKPLSENSIITIDKAMTVTYEGEYIFALSLEREDLRLLSSMLGISVKELQSDYGTKGFLTPGRIICYGDGIKEDLGPARDSSLDALLNFFSETTLDCFDATEDLEEING